MRRHPRGAVGELRGQSSPYVSNHIDCLQAVGGTNVLIENSRFENCAAGTLMNGISPNYNDIRYKNWTLFNNTFQGHVLDFGCGGPECWNGPAPHYAVLASGYFHIYFNSIPDGSYFQDWQPGGDYQLVGNVFGDSPPNHGACTIGGTNGNSNASFSVVKYNVFSSGASSCGDPTNVNGADGFLNSDVTEAARAAGIDLHLTAGAPAIDLVPAAFCSANPSICPPFDVFGNPRPVSPNWDAGAAEYTR